MSNSVSLPSVNRLPEPVAPIAELMSAFSAPWALCGGWAIDAWLGRNTREHQDVDIAVFVQDQEVLFDHLTGWQLVPHDPHVADDSNKLWDGRRLDLPGHLHGRFDPGDNAPNSGGLSPEQGWSLDIQLNDRFGDDWVLSREPRISVPLRNSVRESPWGLPTVVPEVLLFYKAFDLRHRDKLDFETVLPELTREQRDWLRDAVSRVGHPWLSQLS